LLRKIALAMIIAMMLMVVGCGSNEAEDKSMNDSNQSLSREEQQSDTDGQMPALNEDQAIEIVESQLAASSSDDAESKVHLLREAKLGDELIYVFERISTGGRGAASLYFVNSQGTVYNKVEDLMLEHFAACDNKEQYDDGKYLNVDMYLVKMQSINDPEVMTWETHIVDGKAYTDVDAAVRAAVSCYAANDPLLSLLGKDVQAVEKATGQRAQQVVIPDVDGIEDMVGTELVYKGARLSFFPGDTMTDISYPAGTKLLEVTIGDTFEDIIEVLGIPLTIEPDPYFEDIWKMTYEFEDNFYVEFYAESDKGPTVSALVKAL
jgi:hypothetical protein